jgi:hypothetical protein
MAKSFIIKGLCGGPLSGKSIPSRNHPLPPASCVLVAGDQAIEIGDGRQFGYRLGQKPSNEDR